MVHTTVVVVAVEVVVETQRGDFVDTIVVIDVCDLLVA